MAFDVTFWTFTKEVNSTAIPRASDGRVIHNCKANNGIDIISPIISLRVSTAETTEGIYTTTPPYNYCHIPSMNRYYFVENWSWENGLWNAHLSVDVLATYKAQIGNMSAYVLRAAADWDGNISDGLYPAKTQWQYARQSIANQWNWDVEQGTYCVGIVGSGATQFYLFNYTGFSSFLRYILSDNYAADVVGALALQAYQEAKAIIDPLQYISSITFIPITASGLTGSITIPVGFANVSATGKHCVGASVISTTTDAIWSIPAHPYASTRGNYMNYSPYTNRKLEFPPFGIIDLDVSMLPAGSDVYVNCVVDMPTGSGVLRVWARHNNVSDLMTELKGQVGVPIQVGQVINKGMGLLSTIQKAANVGSQIMGGITGGGGTGMTMANMMGDVSTAAGRFGGGIGGAILSGVSGVSGFIQNAIESKIPAAHSIGSLGSFADLADMPCLYSEYAIPVDDSISTRGRPLCQQRILSSLGATSGTNSGYILVSDPDVSGIPGTAMERNMVASFLTGGFYYA